MSSGTDHWKGMIKMATTPATIIQVKDFFGFDGKTPENNMAAFRKQWGELTADDKDQLRTGLGDGTLNYV